ILNGSASLLTAAGPLPSRSSTARRVGSASPWNTRFNWRACWLGTYRKEYLGQHLPLRPRQMLAVRPDQALSLLVRARVKLPAQSGTTWVPHLFLWFSGIPNGVAI